MPQITLVPWNDRHLDALRRANAPELMAELGGPETEAQLLERHERYLRLQGEGSARMFVIATEEHPEGVGTIGYWADGHHEGAIETGWAVEAAHQGQGIARAAIGAVVAHARAEGRRGPLYAYPRVTNEASNALCRKAGFRLEGVEEFEYPKGTWAASNVWALPLD